MRRPNVEKNRILYRIESVRAGDLEVVHADMSVKHCWISLRRTLRANFHRCDDTDEIAMMEAKVVIAESLELLIYKYHQFWALYNEIKNCYFYIQFFHSQVSQPDP